MGSIKKGIQSSPHHAVTYWLESLSKGALADIVLDYARLSIGEDENPARLLEEMIRFASPRLMSRGDRCPRADAFVKKTRKEIRFYPPESTTRQRWEALCAEWDRLTTEGSAGDKGSAS